MKLNLVLSSNWCLSKGDTKLFELKVRVIKGSIFNNEREELYGARVIDTEFELSRLSSGYKGFVE